MTVNWFGGLLLISQVRSSVGVGCFDTSTGFRNSEWAYCQEINPSLFMYYSPMVNEGNLKLGLHAANHTQGWSALALAGNGGMKGASQVVVRKIGAQWVAEDRYSVDYATPQLDTQQDVQLLFASELAGGTSWGVLLKMNSCDEQDYPIEDKSIFMLWALGSSHDFLPHATTTRGQFHANLMRQHVAANASVGMSLSLRMPNASVLGAKDSPDPTNVYTCAAFDLDTIFPNQNFSSSKHHVIEFSASLGALTSKYVHHMILYGCSGNRGFAHLNLSLNCESMPPGCEQMKYAWAVGSESVTFPQNVGMPLGQGERFLMLQMHYYNPQLEPGMLDDSGLKLIIADTTRSIDAGMMTINGGTGPDQRQGLPGLKNNVVLSPMRVPPSCTQNWNSDLSIMSLVHHGHLRGKSFKIEVIRKGKNLGPMRLERLYDFKHQSLEEASIKTLMRGDELAFTCSYDTSAIATNTQFGTSTQTEMCWAAVLYYPAQNQASDFFYKDLSVIAPACLTKASTGVFSRCTELYLTDWPLLFARPSDTTYGASDACAYDPSIEVCPPCAGNRSCKPEDFEQHATYGICPWLCSQSGLPLYPIPFNNSSLPFSSPMEGTYCADKWAYYTPTPSVIDPEACIVRGNANPTQTEAPTTAPTAAPSGSTSQAPTTQVAVSTAPVKPQTFLAVIQLPIAMVAWGLI